MSDDQPSGLIEAAKQHETAEVGFEEPAANGLTAGIGHEAERADPLQTIYDDQKMPEHTRLIAGRLARAELILGQEAAYRQHNQHPLTRSVAQHEAKLDHLTKLVASLSSQQAMAERQLDYQAKGLSLDLAIKALKSENAPISNPGTIVDLADAFLTYLRGAQG